MKIRTGNRLPQWLGKFVLDDIRQPWPERQKTTVRAFREKYPIHDSRLLTLDLVPATSGMVSALFRWETRPLEEEDLSGLGVYLEIAFAQVYRLELGINNRTGTSTVEDMTTRIVSTQEKKEILDASLLLPLFGSSPDDFLVQRISHTVIEDIHKNRRNIFHSEEVEILCLNEHGEVISLPGL